jgi:hypothetical protein
VKVAYDIFGRRLDDLATLHLPRRVPDKLDFSSKKKKKSKSGETFSTLKDHDDRPVVTQPVRNARSQPLSQTESQPTIVLQGHAISEPEVPILHVRNIMIETGKKKSKKSILQRLIPCLRSAKDDDQETKNETDPIEYYEVKDFESKRPKKLKSRFVESIVTMLYTMI